LALAICDHPVLPDATQDFQPNVAVGDIPNPRDPNIDGYQHADILEMVIFYNDNFGIDPDYSCCKKAEILKLVV
jgi:hypothetical protein